MGEPNQGWVNWALGVLKRSPSKVEDFEPKGLGLWNRIPRAYSLRYKLLRVGGLAGRGIVQHIGSAKHDFLYGLRISDYHLTSANLQHLGKPDIRNLGHALAGEKDVGRLQVPAHSDRCGSA